MNLTWNWKIHLGISSFCGNQPLTGAVVNSWQLPTCSIKPQVAEKHREYEICTVKASYKLLINYTSFGLWDDVGTSQRLTWLRKIEKQYPGIVSGWSRWKILYLAEPKAVSRPSNVVAAKIPVRWTAKIRCSRPVNISSVWASGNDRDRKWI